MNISRFFINRPIFATVLSIIIILVGAMAMRVLPIAQYPEVVPPTVSIQAAYPGADAETVSETVAAPLAEQINGVENMMYLNSTSSDDGTMQMQVTFDVGSDGNIDAVNVNNRVQRTLSSLPSEVQAQGVQVTLKSSSILMFAALTSPNNNYDQLYMENYAAIHVIDELKQVKGVGGAQVVGGGEFAMRIWLDPSKLGQYQLTPLDVKNAIAAQNTAVPAGTLGAAPQKEQGPYTYTISAGGRYKTPDEFRNIILRTLPDGGILRLNDVARVELGASAYTVSARLNGKPMAPIMIQQQPGSNALETATLVKAKLAELSKQFPQGLSYQVPYDTTLFINASIESVIHTFIEALLLVAVIVFIFLQNWRSTVIAMSVVPIAVIGTFAGMYMLDFSINLLSLFGMILAIGIVVDDAILVVENVERLLETDRSRTVLDATIEAMREVSGPVIATSFIMGSVFVPVGFLGGLTGQMYQQFAVTIAISVAISALVALTFTPALCALLVKHKDEEKHSRIEHFLATPLRWFNYGFTKITHTYLWFVRHAVRMWLLSLVVLAGACVAAVFVYKQTPSTLIPETDQGVVMAIAQLPNASSLDRTEKYMNEVSAKLRQLPDVTYVTQIAGFDMLNSSTNTARGVLFISMKPWAERSMSANELIGAAMKFGAQTPGGQMMAFNMPPILGLSSTGGFSGYLQSFSGADSKALYEASLKVMQVANSDKVPQLSRVFTLFDANVPNYALDIDKEKAMSYGVALSSIYNTLSGTFGASFVNYFTYQNRSFQVYLQNEGDYRKTPEDLNRIFIRGSGEQLIPLSELVTLKRSQAPSSVSRFNVYPGALFQGSPAPGYSSGEALAAMNKTVQDVLGSDWGMGWTGTSYQESHTGNASTLAIVFGLIMVFLILAAQYESWVMPLAVMTAVPFAFLGAVIAVYFRGLEASVYVQVGFLVVVGLAAKNAILIVEFAELQRRENGMSLFDAAVSAAELRFRPIVMTSLAFIFGTLPLAMATGASDTNSHHIGTTVVGGMFSVMILASVFVPAFYYSIARFQQRIKGEPDNTSATR